MGKTKLNEKGIPYGARKKCCFGMALHGRQEEFPCWHGKLLMHLLTYYFRNIMGNIGLQSISKYRLEARNYLRTFNLIYGRKDNHV